MKLLVAVDLFAEATDTVLRAATWAVRMNATVDLVYADEYYESADFIQDEALREMVFKEWDDYRVRFSTQLDMLMLKVPQTLRGQTLVRQGRPATVLPELSSDYDLLLVSTHQRKGLSRLVMGSVAEQIIRNSAVPVLVMHPDADKTPTE